MSTDFSILEHVETVEGCPKDYHILAKYHYQREIHVPFTKIYKLVGKNEYDGCWPDPLSVICYMQPVPDCHTRNIATGGYFKQFRSTSDRLTLLNKTVLYISRLITDPRFLRRGLGSKLLKDSLSLIDVPMVETMTPIDFTNKIYVRAGFEIFYMPSPIKHKRLVAAFLKTGIVLSETTAPELIDARLAHLSKPMSDYIENEIRLFLSGYRNADRFGPTHKRTKFILSKVPPPEVYLLWLSPTHPAAQKILDYKIKTR
ncbi:MAG: hypothetical protein WAV28_09605 [Sedimentisphaerales bacterium]